LEENLIFANTVRNSFKTNGELGDVTWRLWRHRHKGIDPTEGGKCSGWSSQIGERLHPLSF